MEGPRACRESEFEELVSLINQVFRAGTDQDYPQDYPLVINRSRLKFMRVVKVDGKVVAHVPLTPPREVVTLDDRFTMVIINATLTHPDYRRKGYATLCLRDCIGIAEAEGWPISVLWTMVPTFPFYQHSGFEAVGSQGWMYRLGPEDHELFEANRSFDVIEYDAGSPRHLDGIIEIHDAGPYRIARSREEYQALFSLPKIRTYLAMSRQDVAAYLMFGEGMNKPGVIEGGGAVEALELLVGHVLRRRSPDKETQAVVPLTPTNLGRLLQAKVPAGKRPMADAEGVGGQMIRINNLEKLLRGIVNHLRRRSAGMEDDVRLVCKDTGEGITLKFRNGGVEFSAEQVENEAVLSRRELTQLIFGAHPTAEPVQCDGAAGEILERVFPYYFPIWELDHA